MKKALLSMFFISFVLSSIGALGVAHAKALPVLRLSGADRYETAAAISREEWKASENVVLAAGDGDEKFADAMAGSPMSYALNGPMLLTEADELSTCTRDEIIRLKAKKAVLLGGTGAISAHVEMQLKNMGISVERIWGADRYATAVKVGEKIWTTNPFSKVFLTTGEKFQYAMMIAPFASRNYMPILFTEKDSLNKSVFDALKEWEIHEVDIIGSSDIISLGVEESLNTMGIAVNRVQGFNVGETNINVINTYKMGTGSLAFARDDVFADGLAGASFAALKNMPLVLTGGTAASPEISNFISGSNLEGAYIFGGPGGVSDYIISLIRKGALDSFVSGSMPGNINNGGIAAAKDDWIYYHEGGSLFKVKTNGTEREGVCDDAPMDINVVGDWVYYRNTTDGSKIYKIKTDGTCKTKLNEDESYNITVIDNWIYYINRSDEERLYKMAVDGTYKTRLNDNKSGCMNVKWDYIYYLNSGDDGGIYRVKTDKSVVQKLKNIYASNMNIANGWIYFSNKKDKNSLYKVNTDGTGLIKICDDTAYDMQVAGDWVYYSNGSDNDKLYKIKVDGMDKTVLYEGSACLLNIVGDWICFSGSQEGLLYKIKTDGTGLTEIPGGRIKGYTLPSRAEWTEIAGRADEGNIEWVEVLPEEEVGIQVKDVYNEDGKKVAFLTFDDGPSKTVTPQILDILKEYDIKGTFFVVGRMAKNNEEMIKRIYSEGHTIGNHGNSHEYDYLYGNLNNFMGEVKACESLLKSILGDSYKTKIFRFPGGSFGDKHSSYKAALKEYGYEYINWNASTGDSAGNNIPPESLLDNLRETSKGKGHIVVLMHDLGSKYTTVKALPQVIEYLKSQGYEFKKLL